ncbi:MAG: hypothetical protein WEC34_12300 [Acidimicrobiia bacterium]
MPFFSRHLRFAAAGILAVTLLVSVAPAAGAATQSPKKWAGSVCGALDAWIGDITAASDAAGKAAPTSSAQVKKKLTKVLVLTQGETKTLIKKLKAAGEPDVKGGKQIAATMREGYAQVLRTVTSARKVLSKASTKDPTVFMNAARTAQDALESGLEGIQAAFSAARTADTPALVTAFAANKRCQAVAT